jgi:hypothetical protein
MGMDDVLIYCTNQMYCVTWLETFLVPGHREILGALPTRGPELTEQIEGKLWIKILKIWRARSKDLQQLKARI